MTENNELIRVNVPKTSGFYRLRKAAFFETDKGTFKKMLKALSADVENLPGNARALLEYANERGNAYIIFNNAADRVKTFEAILKAEKPETAAQKKINKAIQAFCSKTEARPVLNKPFESAGVLYASDSFKAVKIENRSVYTGEFFPERSEAGNAPAMGNLFVDTATVKSTYVPVSLPDLSIFKAWTKNGKESKTKRDCLPLAYFKTGETAINAAYIYKSMVLTGSTEIYVNPEKPQAPAYMLSEDFTVIVLPFAIKSLPDPVKTAADGLITINDDSIETLPLHAETVKTIKTETAAETVKAEPETVTTEEKPAETETKAETAGSPAGKEFSDHETAAADTVADSIPETFPETMPENGYTVEPTKTAENGTEGIKGITVYPNPENGRETLKKPIMQCNNDISFPAGRPAVIPERIEKNEYLHKPHEIPEMNHMPVMHEMYRMTEKYNMPKMHNFGNQGFPSAPSAVSAFCEKLYHVLPVLPSVPSAFCRIPAGIPPG